ncbi:MAG: hypothetical protein CFE21_23115 [Bacteroidetes bacterium B1(2017)]|nr:MAG: hypothetical protein CFE21_23115 [Bacteroidetes bacterium B1(2017)]
MNVKSSNFNSKSGILNNYLLKFRTLTTPEASSEYIPQILVFSFCHCSVYINLKHLYATLVGQGVQASAPFLGKDGLLQKFNVVEFDKGGKIEEGFHTRAIIEIDRLILVAERRIQSEK